MEFLDQRGNPLTIGAAVFTTVTDAGAPAWATTGTVVGLARTRVQVRWDHYGYDEAQPFHSVNPSSIRRQDSLPAVKPDYYEPTPAKVTARQQEAQALAVAKQRARDARKISAATPLATKGTGRVPARLRVKGTTPTVVVQADLGSIVVNGKRLYGNRAQRRAHRG